MSKNDGDKYPAVFTVHWPTGPTHCCVKHARALINLGRMLGAHVPATAAPEGSQCANCFASESEQEDHHA